MIEANELKLDLVVAHVSSAHPWTDNRVHFREAASLVEAGFTVHLIAVDDSRAVPETGVQVIRIARRKRMARHNGFIEVLSQYGIVVFSLFCIALIMIFGTGWKVVANRRKPRADRIAGLVLVSVVAMLPVATVMNSSFLEPSTTWLLLAALILVALAIESPITVSDLRGSESRGRSVGGSRTSG